MRDIFDKLFSHPELLIFILIAFSSSIARLFKKLTEKAARQADEQKQRAERQVEGQRAEIEEPSTRRSRARGEQASMGGGQGSRPQMAKAKSFLPREAAGSRDGNAASVPARQVAKPRPTPTAKRPDQDEIAAEIRRMMGLEEAPAPAPVTQISPAPRVRVEAQPEPTASWGPSEKALQSEMTLRQRMEAKEKERNSRTNAIEERHAADGHSIEGRQLARSGARRVGHMLPASGAKQRTSNLSKILDLSNPAAIIVAAEVLGKPVALRDPGSRL